LFFSLMLCRLILCSFAAFQHPLFCSCLLLYAVRCYLSCQPALLLHMLISGQVGAAYWLCMLQ
jgi:hypothetical protein